MPDERPAFTLEADAPRVAELPTLAWALACAGLGFFAGVLARADIAGNFSPGRFGPPVGAGPFVAAAALGCAAALAAIPIGRSTALAVSTAGALAIAAGVAGVAFLNGVAVGGPLFTFALVGLAAPLATLTALRPDAALTPRPQDATGPARWMRAGAMPAALTLGAFGAAAELPLSGLAGPDLVTAEGGAFLALIAGAGIALRALSSIPAPRPQATRERQSARIGALVGMTPMMRHAAAAEGALAFSMAAGLAAVGSAPGGTGEWTTAGAALAVGGIAGAILWRIWAARVDAAFGRGTILSVAYAAAALMPLALAAAGAGLEPTALLVAAALAGFALASGPQRHALAFDLAPSRGRARTSLDGQALKMVAAAAGAAFFAWLGEGGPGLALVAVSAIALVAVALFASTLGGLGRRAK